MPVNICYEPIGIVHSTFFKPDGMPIQPVSRHAGTGIVEVFSPFEDGLKDLEGFSHIILLYHLHKVEEQKLEVQPFLGDKTRGVFATRAPVRPNPIGLSVVRLERIYENRLFISNMDILDETPVLDIKPFIPEFDHYEEVTIGWLEQYRDEITLQRSDERFVK